MSEADAAPAARASAPKKQPEPDRFDVASQAWLEAHIHNSPVARNTDAFNHLLSVLPHLKAKLANEA